MGWNESELHTWLRGDQSPMAPDGAQRGAAGHDAALLEVSDFHPVLCTDRTEEGIHFDDKASPAQIGWKAAARALSDLAATAARPRAILLSLAAPSSKSSDWMKAVITGAAKAAHEFGAQLIGGDLTASRQNASLVVSAHGDFDPGVEQRQAPGRDRAEPGQLLMITGPIGGSILGRHLDIQPRVEEGRALWEAGATAMMDISDGLALDASRIAIASHVVLEIDSIPIHSDASTLAQTTKLSSVQHALFDGEDHELLATITMEGRAALGPVLAFPIGRVLEASSERPPGAYVPSAWLGSTAETKSKGHQASPVKWTRLDPADGRGWIHGT